MYVISTPLPVIRTVDVQRSIEIRAPPEKIWPYLADPEKLRQRFASIEDFSHTSERHGGVGATVSMRGRAVDQVYSFRFVITEWVEDRVFAFRMTSADIFKAYGERWIITPVPGGSCFSFHDRIEFHGAPSEYYWVHC
jgi:uncharacterized protein YndB with AHSA1/START domain